MTYQLYWALIGAAILLGVLAAVAGVVYLARKGKSADVAVALSDTEPAPMMRAMAVMDTLPVFVQSVDQVLISGWTATGVKPQVPQYRVNISVLWTTSDGQSHTWSGAELFPNVLAEAPLATVKEMMQDFILKAVRVRLGIEGW